MKERPILFSAPMVKAILDGSKTQTRRIIKFKNMVIQGTDGIWYDADCINPGKPLKCPYGTAGDRLWARETWADIGTGHTAYRATTDEQTAKLMSWKPSIHMHRHRSRITLEITDVRVQRLQDISAEDAIAEGIKPDHYWDKKSTPTGRWTGFAHTFDNPIDAYQELWESINGKDSWAENPYVWAITFKRILP